MGETVMPNEPDEVAKQGIALLERATQLPDSTAHPSAGSRDNLQLDAELDAWRLMDNTRRWAELQAVIQGERTVRNEVLVYECTRAYKERNRHMLNHAFMALSRNAAPLLLGQAKGLPWHERKSQAQEVLTDLFEAICKGKAAFAQRRFAAFAKRRAISLYRKRRTRFESTNEQIQPIQGNSSPLLDIPMRKPGTEALALLECAQDRLPEKLRCVFIQYHRLGMTLEAIANEHGVSVRSIYNWIKDAEAAIGYSGETHAR